MPKQFHPLRILHLKIPPLSSVQPSVHFLSAYAYTEHRGRFPAPDLFFFQKEVFSMNNLLILSAGGDRRCSLLSAKLSKVPGVTVFSCAQGLSEKNDLLPIRTLSECPAAPDLLLLPIPLTRDGKTIPAPLLPEAELDLEELFPLLKTDTRVYGGLSAPGRPFEAFLTEKGISFTDYLSDEVFTLKNADATAEGALLLAVDLLPVTLRGTRVLITGGGRIAKSLTRLLTAYGAKVFVAARSERERYELSILGTETIPLSILSESGVLPKIRLLLNTVPAPILDGKMLSALPPSALIIELAGNPGGFTPDAHLLSGRLILQAPSLPGKTAPESGADWLFRLVCTKDPVLSLMPC